MTTGVERAAAAAAEATIAADELELRRSYALETARLVRARLDMALALFLVFMGIDVLFERRMPGHDSVIIAYAAEAGICAAAFVLMRTRLLAEHRSRSPSARPRASRSPWSCTAPGSARPPTRSRSARSAS